MLKPEIKEILDQAREAGWAMEPQAKEIMRLAGLPVPDFTWARDKEEALACAREKGFPLAAKVVSKKIVHKSDAGGVAVNIADEDELAGVMDRFAGMEGFEGAVVEPMAQGAELIVGGRVDHQFGPVVLFGMGGTAVEVYKDTVIRMAPIDEDTVGNMILSLGARDLILGHRGEKPLDAAGIKSLVAGFSRLLMDLEDEIESVDLNPVMCSHKGCNIADARIMLAR
ncbi:MAG: acetate--CoA ligase family protein [Deltaproteobacteria bacterium]|nr:acetate--CoA ligase family protein [Deltaproteobacteria bacterium]